MSTIFWDTNLFIYLIEQTPPEFYKKVVELRKRMITDNDKLVTSTLTLGEVLVKPFEANRTDLARMYEGLLRSREVVLVEFDGVVAENYAKIRAKYGKKVKPPDAIQLACASAYRADIFITNDNRLNGIQIPDLGGIAPLQSM